MIPGFERRDHALALDRVATDDARRSMLGTHRRRRARGYEREDRNGHYRAAEHLRRIDFKTDPLDSIPFGRCGRTAGAGGLRCNLTKQARSEPPFSVFSVALSSTPMNRNGFVVRLMPRPARPRRTELVSKTAARGVPQLKLAGSTFRTAIGSSRARSDGRSSPPSPGSRCGISQSLG